MSVPAWQHFTCLVASSCCRNSVTPLGEDLWKLAPVSLHTLLQMPFLFADGVLHPFTAINHSCEYNYMLNLVSPGEALNLGVILGNPSPGGI